MIATDVLMAEHRVIEQVLNCLGKMADRCLLHGDLDFASARQALDFFQHFADRCHHGKEEERLFPLLEARGLSRERGPTGVMLREHDLGRRQIQAMLAAVDEAAQGDSDAVQRFGVHAGAYVRLLREHISKEDHCLFPMANQVLTPQDQHSLEDAFQEVESKKMGSGTHEKYLELANELADRFEVPRASLDLTLAQGCGCGARQTSEEPSLVGSGAGSVCHHGGRR
jgi:hemerythrin-like domain-containing protein